MYRLLFLICCIGAISVNSLKKNNHVGRSRIIRGDEIKIEQAPYQISIVKFDNNDTNVWTHRCGGSIILKNLVLTAGHCVQIEPQEVGIISGSNDWSKGGKIHRIVKIVKHEDYEKDLYDRPSHDVAIIKVEPDFELDGKTTKIVKLADEQAKVGDDAYVTGWGKTEREKYPKLLRGLALKIIDFKKCSKYYRFVGYMTEHNICAEHPSRTKDFCDGDSGSPLVANDKQIGIVSWGGPDCAIPGRPGVYTDVAKYYDWIEKHVVAGLD